MDRDVLILTVAAAQKLAPDKYRVLLTKVPPSPEPEGPALRKELVTDGIAVFIAEIPRLKAFEHAAASGVPVNLRTTVPAVPGSPTKPPGRKSQMAEGKFSGLGAAIKEAQQQPHGEAEPQRTDRMKPHKGRAAGKRSDPAWRQHTVMLKRETHIEASDILPRQENGQDISELLQSLLEQWVKRQRKS
jgi:hypothetical protein